MRYATRESSAGNSSESRYLSPEGKFSVVSYVEDDLKLGVLTTVADSGVAINAARFRAAGSWPSN